MMFNFFKKEKKTNSISVNSKNVSFEPQNNLEKAILDFINSKISEEDFYTTLVNANIRVLSEVPDAKQQKFFTIFPDGEIPYLAIFTDNDRTSKAKERKQGFDYLFVLPLTDLFSFRNGPFGLLINPFWEFELKLSPELVTKISTNIIKINDLHEKIIAFTALQRGEGSTKVNLFDVIEAIKRSTIGVIVHDNQNMDMYYTVEDLEYEHKKISEPYCHIISDKEQQQFIPPNKFNTKVVIVKGESLFNALANGSGIIINPGSINMVQITPRQLFMRAMINR